MNNSYAGRRLYQFFLFVTVIAAVQAALTNSTTLMPLFVAIDLVGIVFCFSLLYYCLVPKTASRYATVLMVLLAICLLFYSVVPDSISPKRLLLIALALIWVMINSFQIRRINVKKTPVKITVIVASCLILLTLAISFLSNSGSLVGRNFSAFLCGQLLFGYVIFQWRYIKVLEFIAVAAPLTVTTLVVESRAAILLSLLAISYYVFRKNRSKWVLPIVVVSIVAVLGLNFGSVFSPDLTVVVLEDLVNNYRVKNTGTVYGDMFRFREIPEAIVNNLYFGGNVYWGTISIDFDISNTLESAFEARKTGIHNFYYLPLFYFGYIGFSIYLYIFLIWPLSKGLWTKRNRNYIFIAGYFSLATFIIPIFSGSIPATINSIAMSVILIADSLDA